MGPASVLSRAENADVIQNFTPEVKEKAAIYVPAIGKVTIAILLRNLLRLAQNQVQAALPAATTNGAESTPSVISNSA